MTLIRIVFFSKLSEKLTTASYGRGKSRLDGKFASSRTTPYQRLNFAFFIRFMLNRPKMM